MSKPKSPRTLRRAKSPLDTIKPKKQGELTKSFDESLKDEVEKMALKHEVTRLHSRKDNIISQGVGGKELDLFEQDYTTGYSLSKTVNPKPSKESKKNPESKVFLRKVSQSVPYKTIFSEKDLED